MPSLEIQLLGTGNAFHADGRGSSCVWLDPGDGTPFLVDLGPSAPLALQRFRVDASAIDRLFVTHLHGDHVAGWPFLLLEMALGQRRTRPFDVWGPECTRDCLTRLASLAYGSLLDPATLGFEVRFHELPVREARGLDAGGATVDVLPMEHHASSIGYRFALRGASIAVSGDTRWCENLERLSRDADLLVVECTTLAREAPPHVSLEELRERRSALGPGRIVLVHLDDAVATSLASDPLPGVIAGHDGMRIVL